MEFERVPPFPRIALERAGEGATVVFLHGVGGNRSNWRRQIRELSQQFQCVAFDARGYGDSDDCDGPLSIDDFTADLERVLDYCGARSAHVVGLSMGGMVAQHFWRVRRERVASLVLCDTAAGRKAGFTANQRAEFLRSRKAPLLKGRTPRDIAPDLAKALASPRATQAAIRELIGSIGALRVQGYIKALDVVAAWQGIGDLSEIDVPTLVVVGEDDRLTPPAISRDIAAQIPRARLAVIGGAGHLSNIERPAVFNARLLEFLLGLRTPHE